MLLLVGVVRPPPMPTMQVAVAASDLGAGSVLTAGDLRTGHVTGGPDGVGTVGAVHDAGELVGRRLTSPMAAGEVFTSGKLIPRSAAEGLPSNTVAAHVLVADERSLDLISAGRRVSLFADTGGAALAQDVLVLGVDLSDTPTLTGSLSGSQNSPRGLIVALPPTAVERIFAGQRPEGGPPRILAVMTR